MHHKPTYYLKSIIKALFFILFFALFIFYLNDNFLTIRDFDYFFIIKKTGISGYISRPLITLLTFILSKLLSINNIIIIKKIFGKITILIYLFVYYKLLNNISLTKKQIFYALFLGCFNFFTIVFFDSLSPYFVIQIFSILQIINCLHIIKEQNTKKNFLFFHINSLLLLLCHPLTIINYLTCLTIIYQLNRKELFNKANKKYFLAFFVMLLIIVSLFFMWMLQNKSEITSPEELQFFGVEESTSQLIKKYTVNYLQIIPKFLGINITELNHTNLTILICTNLIFFLLIILNKRNHNKVIYHYLFCYFTLFVAFSLFWTFVCLLWPKNHLLVFIYSSAVFPILSIVLAKQLDQIKFGLIVLAFVLIFNIYNGINYRKEAFDHVNYNKFCTQLFQEKELKTYIVPSSLANAYKQFIPDIVNPNIYKDYIYNIGNISDCRFYLDIINYNEFGIPLYEYERYKNQLINYFKMHNYQYKKYQQKTFTRYLISKPQKY